MSKRRNRRNRASRARAASQTSRPVVPGGRLPLLVAEAHAGQETVELPPFNVNGELCPEIHLQGPVVAELADLVAMRVDLELVISLCNGREQLAAGVEITEDVMIMMRGMWEAAVIAYGRAFVKGKSADPERSHRTVFPRDVLASLSAEQRAIHDKTIEHRHQHVGHRVNDWLQIRVTAVLAPEGSDTRGLLTLAERMMTVVEGGPAAGRLREVATILCEGVVARIVELEQKIQQEIVADFSADELYDIARTNSRISIT